jgi:hypothetical protein
MKNQDFEKLFLISDEICSLILENYKTIKKSKEIVTKQEYNKVPELQNELNKNITCIRELQLKSYRIGNASLLPREYSICFKFIESLKKIINSSHESNLNYYNVIPERLYVGDIPSSVNQEITKYKLNELVQIGVTKIIDLTEKNEFFEQQATLFNYEVCIKQNEEFRNLKVERFSLPHSDVPTIEKMLQLLKIINNDIITNETIYIHSLEDLGRTTLAVGCFIVNEGIIQNNYAVEFIDYLRRNTSKNNNKSTDTIKQFNYIKTWEKQ